jgi:hypothetical protein
LKTTQTKSIYLRQIEKEFSRLISMEDRESFSKTYGCFDRTYWAWKFTDFAGSRYQEAVYALAYFYKRPFDRAALEGNEKILRWARAGLKYWQNLQHSDGSFDEAYPSEQSLAATAFTCFYLGESYLMLIEDLPEPEKESLRKTFLKAGNWLCNNDEKHGILSNHLAVAAVSLFVIFKITGDTRFEQRSKYFLTRIYSCQSKEGWYEEYGGVDVGYQTHTIFYLARLWQYTHDEELLASLNKSISFQKYLIHPDGTMGGEYGSRDTEFYLPAGFEILVLVCPDAALIAKFMRGSVNTQTGVGLSSMDAQNFMPLFNNYLFAAEYSDDLDSISGSLPFEQEGEWEFPDAGLVVKSNYNYHAIFSLSKGGVLKVYNCKKRELSLSDCGYWAMLKNGRITSNQGLNRSGQINREGNKFLIKVPFKAIKQKNLSPFLFILFRLFSLTFGKVRSIAYWLKFFLVKVLVTGHRPVPINFTRKVRFSKNEIHLEDQIDMTENLDLKMLKSEAKFSTIHMGSSRYFCRQEMDSKSIEGEDLSGVLMKNRTLSIERIFKFE